MLCTLKKTQKWDSTQYLFVLSLYPFCLLSSIPFNFITPFCLCCTTLANWNEAWCTSGISVPVSGLSQNTPFLLVYRAIAVVSKLICQVVDGKISRCLRLLQYLPIQLPHPGILLPSKMQGVLLVKSLLPIIPLNSCKLLLQTHSSYFSQCWNLKILNLTLKLHFI